MISVIIPLYNKADTICRAINSVAHQTYQDYEIIVVDDGSIDNSVSLVEGMHLSKLRVIRQANAGVAVARNHGIEKAKGEYVAFLDADDEWKPENLAIKHLLTEKYPQCDVFASDYELQDWMGRITNTQINGLAFDNEDGILSNYFEIASHSSPPLWTSAVMVRRTAIKDIGGFPPGVRSGEDLLTWARLAVRCKIAYSRMISSIYHLGDGYDKKNLPPRKQDEGDPVGKGLKEILKNYPSIKGLRSYNSHWHRMRASVAIRYGLRGETFREVLLSLKYDWRNLRTASFAFLAVLPLSIRRKIIAYHG